MQDPKLNKIVQSLDGELKVRSKKLGYILEKAQIEKVKLLSYVGIFQCNFYRTKEVQVFLAIRSRYVLQILDRQLHNRK